MIETKKQVQLNIIQKKNSGEGENLCHFDFHGTYDLALFSKRNVFRTKSWLTQNVGDQVISKQSEQFFPECIRLNLYIHLLDFKKIYSENRRNTVQMRAETVWL